MPKQLASVDMLLRSNDNRRAVYIHPSTSHKVMIDTRMFRQEPPKILRVTIETLTVEDVMGDHYYPEPVSPFVGMGWGHAFRLMRNGNKVARKNWNGKGMYLFYVHSGQWDAAVPSDCGSTVLCPFVALKTADNKIVPWTASQTDMLAEDWMVVQ
jgi:hypothetical protein